MPICYSCALHEGDLDDRMTCDTYPDGIPEQFLDSAADHRVPYSGDHGIQFVQNPDRPPPDPLLFGEPR